MDGRTLFTELRNVLATLYLLPADAQRVATEAGIDLRQIAFDAKAINNWDHILTVAIEYAALDAVLDVAYVAHPKYQPLVQIRESYRRFVAAGGKIEAPLLLDRNEGRTAPMMALAPPSDYVQRSKEFTQLVDYLLAGNEQPVAITATIRGAGGFGKTTLAQAICKDKRIRAAFPDGILWATIGDEKANVLLGLRKFYHALTGREAQFVDQQDATTQLSSVLAARRCLLVIDDVWNAAHLQPFLEGGKQCARLVTTRMASVIPKEANVVTLDAMRMREATDLLGAGLKKTDAAVLTKLAQRLGEWPLLLKLVNRRLYEDVERHGVSLTDAIDGVNEELDELGLTSFDVTDVEERSQAVAASMGVSLHWLDVAAPYGRIQVDEGARFRELAIFPEDVAIPLATLTLLWQQSAIVTERLCRRLADLALILRYDGQTQTILLHDVTRHYLLSQAAPEQLVGWHRTLLAGYQRQCAGVWWQLPNDGYVYQNLLWHLHEAQRQESLEELLFIYEWLDAKLQATDIVSMVHDFDLRHDKGRHAPLSLLKHALQMSSSVLARDKDQLVSQLYGRLKGLGKQWESLVKEIAQQKRASWLQPKTPNLTPPGGNLLYTLSGHSDEVDNLLLAPNDRLISSCSGLNTSYRDISVKVWDLTQGVLLYSLEGHTAGVSNLLLTPDGRLISSCTRYDYSIKVWDLTLGVLLHSLEGHTSGVTNLLLTPDGRLISSCQYGGDMSIKVWDIAQGVLLHSFKGHTDRVTNLLLTPNGRLISSCRSNKDMSIKVWDVTQGVLLHSLDGHTDSVSNLLLTPDGWLISSCRSNKDMSIKVWDVTQGVLLHSLDGHTSGVDNLLLTPDGWLISSCNSDKSIKVWDVTQGVLLHSLDGHTSGVDDLFLTSDGQLLFSSGYSSRGKRILVWNLTQGVLLHSTELDTERISKQLFTSDGRLVSSHSHNTFIRVWDLTQEVLTHSLEGNTNDVDNLLPTPNGLLVSSHKRGTSIKVWDVAQGVLLHSLESHIDGVSNLLLTSDGRLLSSCGSGIDSKSDKSIKVWDVAQGVLLHSLEGHTDGVSNLLLTSDGRLLSSCGSGIGSKSDKSIKVWDVTQGMLLHSLEGHTDGVTNLLLTPDGRLISSSGSNKDKSIKVWDVTQGVLLHSLEGHTSGVTNLLLTPDGRLISSCSNKDKSIKVWDVAQGVLLHSLEGHTSGVTNLLLTPDGRLISSCNSDKSIKVWDVTQGVLLYSLEGHIDGVSNLLLTPHGRLLSSSYSQRSNSIKVWDVAQGVLLHSFEGHTSHVRTLLLTPDGRLLSSCISNGYDMSVKVWDIEAGVLLHSLDGHVESIQFMFLSHVNGCLIVTGGNQLTAWNWASGKKVAQFTTDVRMLSCTQADDGTIVAGGALGRVYFLKLVIT